MIRQPPSALAAVEKVHRLERLFRLTARDRKNAALLALHLSELDDEAQVFARLVCVLLDSEEISSNDLLETLVAIETALEHLEAHVKGAQKEITRIADAVEVAA